MERLFPKGLDHVGLIVMNPTADLREWKYSFELKEDILDAFICYQNLKGITSKPKSSVQSKIVRKTNVSRKKLSRFAHSRECPAPRKWPFLPKQSSPKSIQLITIFQWRRPETKFR